MDLNEEKYQYVIKKSGKNGIQKLKDSKDFIKYSNKMKDIYKKCWKLQPMQKM